MALNSVSSKIVDAVYARLSAPTGVNLGIATLSPLVGIQPFLVVDWSPTSNNFVFGQTDPALITKTGIFTYPFSCLYILDSAQTGIQKFTQFSGSIRCIYDVYLSWVSIKGQQNYEVYPNCLEAVVFDVINRVENQNWGKPLVYNGMIQCRRGPLQFSGSNFQQRVTFQMIFELHQ